MHAKKLNLKWNVLIAGLVVGLPVMAQDAEMAESSSAMISEQTKFWLLLGMLVFQIILLFTVSGIIKSLTNSSSVFKKILNTKSSAAMLTGLFVLIGGSAVAQDGAAATVPFTESTSIHNLLIALNGVLLIGIVILLATLKNLVNVLTADAIAEKEPVSIWSRFMVKMTDAVPVEEEEDVLTDHDYDGIQELDNNLPPWWVLGFYVTIACAVVYIGYYEFYLGGNISQQEFKAEMQKAEEQREAYLATLANNIDESNVVAVEDASKLQSGKKIFDTYCATCHAKDGGGLAGPNLTDEYWLHGGGIKNVFKTIKYGVAGKSMIAWEDQLTPPQMQEVASYVLNLEGTTPEKPKDPEGEKWVAPTETEEIKDNDQTDTTAVEANDQVAEVK